MNRAASQTRGIHRQRGFWLRCFLSALWIWCSFLPLHMARAQSFVDCVYPRRVSVSRIQGRVFDPFGVPVPGVVITLVDEDGRTLQTKSDGGGRFQIAASPGKYSFKADFPMFQTSDTELAVGEDLIGFIHPSHLYVILGLTGSECAWITTSRKEFEQVISDNKKKS